MTKLLQLVMALAALVSISLPAAAASSLLWRHGGIATVPLPITSIFGNTAPVTLDGGDANPAELGMQFSSHLAGQVVGCRFYKATTNPGPHICNLWSVSGTNLASVAVTGETASGWQQMNFASPVSIAANTTYVISYYAPSGHYSVGVPFTSDINNPPLTGLANASVSPGNGIYIYSSTSAFPTQTFGSSDYMVDLTFNYMTVPQTPSAIVFVPAGPITVVDSIPTSTAISAVNVSTNDGFAFPTAYLSLAANAGGRVALSGYNIVPAHNFTPADDGSGLTVTVQASENGTTLSQSLTLNVVPQTIQTAALSGTTFQAGAPSGTVIGAIIVAMNPATPAFSGSLSLVASGGGCSGGDISDFQIIGGNLATNGSPTVGSYTVCIQVTQSGISNSPQTFSQTVTGSIYQYSAPGPSAALFASPYYTCNQNWYISTSGNDSNSGTSGSRWLTLNHALAAMTVTGTGSWCVNFASGTYNPSSWVVGGFPKGGTTASSTGYLVVRCETLDGCIMNGQDNANLAITNTPNAAGKFVIVDGFEMVGTNGASGDNYQQGITTWDGGGGACSGGVDCVFSTHHIMVLNSIIHGFSQSGIQMNDGEYFYISHNRIYGNSRNPGCSSTYGSGISIAPYKQITVGTYTPTADDTNATNNAALNLIGIQGPSFAFHNIVSGNVVYNDIFNNSCSGSDSNGIIFDSTDNYYNSWGSYLPRSLAAFNVIYNNGGFGIWSTNSQNITIANNSCYNNALQNAWNSTDRPCLGGNVTYGMIYENNVAWAIPGSGNLSYNKALEVNCNGGGSPCDSAFNNVSYCTSGGTGGCEAAFNGATYSCSTNKCTSAFTTVQSNAFWANVGRTSTGTGTTQPVGTNFALCTAASAPNAACTGVSPAIGYVTTETFLPPGVRDSGACDRSFTVCP